MKAHRDENANAEEGTRRKFLCQIHGPAAAFTLPDLIEARKAAWSSRVYSAYPPLSFWHRALTLSPDF